MSQCGNETMWQCGNVKIDRMHQRMFLAGLREGWKWKAHSAEARQARTCNGQPDPAVGRLN